MSQKLWHLCRSALILVSPLGIWKMLLNLTFFCLKNQDNNEDRFYWLKRQMMDGLEVFATSWCISHTSNASKLKLVKKHQFASWHQIYGNFQCKIKKLEKIAKYQIEMTFCWLDFCIHFWIYYMPIWIYLTRCRKNWLVDQRYLAGTRLQFHAHRGKNQSYIHHYFPVSKRRTSSEVLKLFLIPYRKIYAIYYILIQRIKVLVTNWDTLSQSHYPKIKCLFPNSILTKLYYFLLLDV